MNLQWLGMYLYKITCNKCYKILNTHALQNWIFWASTVVQQVKDLTVVTVEVWFNPQPRSSIAAAVACHSCGLDLIPGLEASICHRCGWGKKTKKQSWIFCFGSYCFFSGYTQGTWKFPDQGSNPSHSCKLCHSCGNAGSGQGIESWPPQQGDSTEIMQIFNQWGKSRNFLVPSF